jgi:hypothetical protein
MNRRFFGLNGWVDGWMGRECGRSRVEGGQFGNINLQQAIFEHKEAGMAVILTRNFMLFVLLTILFVSFP